MSATPLVSIILPTYNREEVTLRAVDSVLIQNYPHWELILVDDGSEDNTWQILTASYLRWKSGLVGFGKNSKTVQIHQTMHRGVSAARNFGVSQSNGEWICFLDSDDVWNENKVSEQIRFHQANPAYRISQTNEIWNKKGNLLEPLGKHKKQAGNFFQDALELCLITSSSVMMEKSLFQELGGFKEELPSCEDYDLWNRILARGEKVGLLEENLLMRYGGHSDQLSLKYNAIERFRLYSLFLLYKEVQNSPELFLENASLLIEESIDRRMNTMIQGRKKRGKSLEEWERLNTLISEHQSSFDPHILSFLLEDSHFS